MGLATSVQTEYGYYITGDTDATTIWTDGRRYIQSLAFVPGATDDTIEISTTKQINGAYTLLWASKSNGVAGVAQDFHLDGNIPADNLRVKFSNGAAKLFIYLRSR